ncbi:MAG: hypothetical protein KGO01_19500 [Burkholderiales bacterium]|nr:hypothetical protein [Burkholderiales bacterium]
MTIKRTEPTQSLLRGMPYTPACRTDIRALFARVRAAQATPKQNVAPINSRKQRKAT